MYKILASLTLLLLLCTLAVSQQESDKERQGLQGVVRSVRSQITPYFDGVNNEGWLAKLLDTVIYERNGHEIERTVYDDYGLLVGKEIRKRNNDGNLSESVLYDSDGAVLLRRVFVYDREGRLIEIVSYGAKGEIGERQKNAYDRNGQLSEESYYDQLQAFGKTVYKSQGNGKISEVAFFLADGQKAIAHIGPCLGAHRVTYEYDKQGRATKVIAYEPDGKVKKKWRYSYNSVGQVIEDIRDTGSYRKRFTYTYEFDPQGNWTKQIATIETSSLFNKSDIDVMKSVTLREIVYY